MSLCCGDNFCYTEDATNRDDNGDDAIPENMDLEKDFAERTTCHGMSYWFSYINRTQRIAWIILVLGSFGGLFFQIYDLAGSYFLYESSTNSLGEFVTKIDFPAVTICNYNRYFADSPDEVELFHFLNRISSPSFLELNKTFSAPDLPANVFERLIKSMPNFSISGYLERKGYQLEDNITEAYTTLLDCRFHSLQCTISDFKPILTRLGKCYTFNPNTSHPLEQTVAGYGQGFSVALDVLHNEYTEEAIFGHQEAGIMFQVHPQHESPDIERFGIAVPTGHKGFAMITRSDYQIMYSPWGKCFPDIQRKLKYFEVYTSRSCMQECYTDNLIERCHCRRFDQTWAVNVSECTIEQVISCATEVSSELERTLTPEACLCFQPCSFTDYSTRISYATFPSAFTKRHFEDLFDPPINNSPISDNYVSLEVTFREIGYTQVTQSKKIDEAGLLSDIGGQLGVWVGMSFLTVVEFLQYIVMKVDAITAERRRERRKKEALDTSSKPTTQAVENPNLDISKATTQSSDL